MIFLPGLKFGDYGIFILSVTLTLGSFFYATVGGQGALQVEIEGSDGRFIYPLDQENIFSIQGVLGESTLKIDKTGVSFLDSPCTNKLCVHQGAQDNPGDWAACLPNKVFFRVTGKSSEEAPDVGTW